MWKVTQGYEYGLSPVKLQEGRENFFLYVPPQSLTCKEFVFIFELLNHIRIICLPGAHHLCQQERASSYPSLPALWEAGEEEERNV